MGEGAGGRGGLREEGRSCGDGPDWARTADPHGTGGTRSAGRYHLTQNIRSDGGQNTGTPAPPLAGYSMCRRAPGCGDMGQRSGPGGRDPVVRTLIGNHLSVRGWYGVARDIIWSGCGAARSPPRRVGQVVSTRNKDPAGWAQAGASGGRGRVLWCASRGAAPALALPLVSRPPSGCRCVRDLFQCR